MNDYHIDLDSDSNNSPKSSIDGPNQSTLTDRLTTNILEVKGGRVNYWWERRKMAG
ncbi:hypothetical protein BDZ91DRAFT_502000 [Kalaharituber pfeilii]|nr:hypothetical protein BDZ91DRAFT_502000 [Kalaharituber pfeilii]